MIHIHNDGKGKSQSFEATIGDIDEFGNKLLGGDNVVGYGATPEEAIEELKQAVQKHINTLTAQLSAVDYSQTLPVDWAGKPLSVASFYGPNA